MQVHRTCAYRNGDAGREHYRIIATAFRNPRADFAGGQSKNGRATDFHGSNCGSMRILNRGVVQFPPSCIRVNRFLYPRKSVAKQFYTLNYKIHAKAVSNFQLLTP